MSLLPQPLPLSSPSTFSSDTSSSISTFPSSLIQWEDIFSSSTKNLLTSFSSLKLISIDKFSFLINNNNYILLNEIQINTTTNNLKKYSIKDLNNEIYIVKNNIIFSIYNVLFSSDKYLSLQFNSQLLLSNEYQKIKEEIVESINLWSYLLSNSISRFLVPFYGLSRDLSGNVSFKKNNISDRDSLLLLLIY